MPLPPTAPALSPDEQRVLNMMTGSSKAATTGLHFDSIRTSSQLKQNGAMITGTALLPILQSLQQKGLVNVHASSTGLQPKVSYWIPTGLAGSSSVATPHAAPPVGPVPPPEFDSTSVEHAALQSLVQNDIPVTQWMSGSMFPNGTQAGATLAYLTSSGHIKVVYSQGTNMVHLEPSGRADLDAATAYAAWRASAPTMTGTTSGGTTGAGTFNAPPPGSYRVGPNGCFIQYGAKAGALPGAPVYATALRAGRSTLPLDLNDMGPAAGSQPYLDAAKYPDRNHAAEFSMAYQGPTGAIITLVHGASSGVSTLAGSTVSGLRPGGTNAYGYGLYAFAGKLDAAVNAGYCRTGPKSAAYELEFHSGRVIDDRNTQPIVDAWMLKNPQMAAQLAHDDERQKAAALLDAGYSAISMNYSGSPAYVVLDPSRCRIKSVFDNLGTPHKLPNGQTAPPPSAVVMSPGKDKQKHWTGAPDLAAAKDPTMVARNISIGASPTVPLSDNGAAIIGRIYKSQGGKMSQAAINGARDVTSALRAVRGVENVSDLLTILDSDSLVSGAELGRRIALAKADPSSAGQALYKKLAAVTTKSNADDKALGLDDSVFLTLGSPTTNNSYGPISLVYGQEVLNQPGVKVNLHGVNAYNDGGAKPINVKAWQEGEIDGLEASEVMAFQLAAGYPVTGANGKVGKPQNDPGALSSPAAYMSGHDLLAREQAEVHVPTSLSHHNLSHCLIPAGEKVTLPGSKANALDPYWNVAPGMHDRLTTQSGAGRRADSWQSMNNGVDGQSLMLDGQSLTLHSNLMPDGTQRWQFEVPKTGSKTISLKDHLEALFKKKGLDVQVVETNAGSNNGAVVPHKTAVFWHSQSNSWVPKSSVHANVYGGICYGSV